MRVLTFALTVSLGLAASLAQAHGPQLQITDDNNKLVTRQIILNEPYSFLTFPKSVYVIPMAQLNGVWYSQPNSEIDPILMQAAFPSGPGLAYGYDQVDGGPRVFAAGSAFSEKFTAGLKRWNGSAFVDPGSEQIGVFRGSAVAPADQAVTSDSGPFGGITYPAISATYVADDHSSARFRLLGDGTNPLSPSQDGVYLLSLQLSSTQAGLASSDPFYFVLRKSATDAAVNDAVNSFINAQGIPPSQVQFVPEPTSLLLLVLATTSLVAMASLRWRSRCEDI
jgi:hypothetical protein